jgi:phosphoribosylformimino-5-aminoimidazole carboxamide ribotide isomerase
VILYPAIDILDGAVVRLVQGDFAQSTAYAPTPLDAARDWAAAGARRLHVVDLDGARAGEPVNLASIAAIAAQTGLPIQLGGGLRSADALAAAFAAGVWRVVLGTAAFGEPALLDGAIAEHGDRVAVSIDTRGGMVSTAGWTRTGTLPATDAAAELSARGVRSFIYTDIDRDGMLGGPALDAIVRVTDSVEGEVVYSGGVSSLEDLRALAALEHPRLAGVIAGTALYEGRFTIAQAQEALCSSVA